ncbi:MAG: T9SS type A sorting domain-containing protein [Bacteroidetes bacterium]|nr:T9SS type A sorting domain-containing protein [Bacteroidota bacterium]
MKLISKGILFLTLWHSAATAQTPTWAEDVAPILYQNCTSCHIDGGIGKFSLVGYNQAKNWASGIKYQTQNRTMPPWPADPKYKRYAHERILSTEEIKTLADWVDGNTPQGDLSKAPVDPVAQTGILTPNPDKLLKMENYVATTNTDEYRCFVIPAGISSNQYLTSIEVIPGNRKAVHHVLVFYDTSKIPLQKDIADPKPGYIGFGGTGSSTSTLVGLWVPGAEPYAFPAGMGIQLLKNGYFILQIHYPGGLNSELDSTKVAMKLSSGPLRQVFISPPINHDGALQNGPLYIAPGTTKSFNAKYTLPLNVTAFAVGPHMHLIGRSIKAWAVNTNGDTTPLISIPKWDFHWQRQYSFRNPIKLTVGSTIWGQASYDNTTANPFNPNNPPLGVSVGEKTTDEMLLIYFWYTAYQAGDENIVIDGSTPKNIGTVLLEPNHEMAKAWPNPTEDLVHLETTGFKPGLVNVKIYAATGQCLAELTETNIQERISLQVSHYPSGLYHIQVQQGRQLQTVRVYKQ